MTTTDRPGIDREALRRSAPAIVPADPRERALALEILRFGEVLADVEADYRPNLLTAWLYDLASAFSAWYRENPVLNCPDPDLAASRIDLVRAVQVSLRIGTGLVGIPFLEAM